MLLNNYAKVIVYWKEMARKLLESWLLLVISKVEIMYLFDKGNIIYMLVLFWLQSEDIYSVWSPSLYYLHSFIFESCSFIINR